MPKSSIRPSKEAAFDRVAANPGRQYEEDGLAIEGERWEEKPVLYKLSYLTDFAAAFDVAFDRLADAVRPLLGMDSGDEFPADIDWFLRREHQAGLRRYGRIKAAARETGPGLPSIGPADDVSVVGRIRRELEDGQRQIAIFWSVDDMRAVRPELSADQAWGLLQRLEQEHDGDRGITWEVIEQTARAIYPDRTGRPAECGAAGPTLRDLLKADAPQPRREAAACLPPSGRQHGR